MSAVEHCFTSVFELAQSRLKFDYSQATFKLNNTELEVLSALLYFSIAWLAFVTFNFFYRFSICTSGDLLKLTVILILIDSIVVGWNI